MPIANRTRQSLLLATGLFVLATAASAEAAGPISVGTIRISSQTTRPDPAPPQMQYTPDVYGTGQPGNLALQNPPYSGHGCNSCQGCNSCSTGNCGQTCRRKGTWWGLCHGFNCAGECWKNAVDCPDDCEGGSCEGGEYDPAVARAERLRRRYGYFCPEGCCGKGCPRIGTYHMAYSVYPPYSDPRDHRIYAAHGYGVPMAVPLAPNVRHTYNFSWGIPASRLTPVSRYIPEGVYADPALAFSGAGYPPPPGYTHPHAMTAYGYGAWNGYGYGYAPATGAAPAQAGTNPAGDAPAGAPAAPKNDLPPADSSK